jgi:glycosyltransferase involved in cell wall biosynthesis
MRILMLSRDATGLDSSSGTAKRWRLLRDAGVTLDIIVATSSNASWKEDGIEVRGTGGGRLTKFCRARRRASRSVVSADLVTAQDPFELGLVAWCVSRRLKKPFEVQDHGGFFDGETPDEPLWPIRSKLAWWLARRASSIRTVSPKSLSVLTAKGIGDKTYWLPISADERFSRIERNPEPGLVVTVSRLIPVKRVDLLLQVFAEVAKQNSQARLVVFGYGPERQKLERQAVSLKIQNIVQFVKTDDTAPYLSRASLFVSLSKHEGWGIASVEAAMAGVPVVMTDTGCGPWLQQQGLATVVPVIFKTEDVANVLRSQLEKPPSTERLRDAVSQKEAILKQVSCWRKH